MALLGAALVALALVVAAAAAFALVGFLSHALPPPSGPYPVGTLLLPFEFGSAAPQRLAQVWYPTVARGTSAYAPGEPGLRGWYHRLIRTAAATGAAPARLADEPLVVYVPAWGGHRWENTALASELASYGYVVAALDDVDHSSVPGAPGPRPFALETATEALASISYADWKVVREAALVSRLIDVLFADHRFAPLLDRRRIGAVGYSFGGAAAAEACRRDPRIRAVVNFDGWLWGPAASQGFPCPYLLIGEQGDVNDLRIPSERRAAAIDRSDARNQQAQFEREGGFKLLFAHTQHSSFGDAPLYSLRLRFADRALASPRDTLRIVAAYVRAFFDRTLEGRPAPLLSAPPPPGATFERFLPHRGKRSA